MKSYLVSLPRTRSTSSSSSSALRKRPPLSANLRLTAARCSLAFLSSTGRVEVVPQIARGVGSAEMVVIGRCDEVMEYGGGLAASASRILFLSIDNNMHWLPVKFSIIVMFSADPVETFMLGNSRDLYWTTDDLGSRAEAAKHYGGMHEEFS